METRQEIADILREVRLEFIETTVERLTTLDDLITAMMEERATDNDLLDLQRHVHSIKGQGTTFDFPTVTKVAHRMEDYMETVPRLGMQQLQAFQRFVDAIRGILESGTNPADSEAARILTSLPVTAWEAPKIATPREVKLLIVLPKGLQRKIIGREMASCGFHIFNAETPVDGLALAIEQKPDIVVASGVMTQMSGKEFAWVLNAVETTKHCHLIIASSADDDSASLSGLPPEVAIAHKGERFNEELTEHLISWGFFGKIGAA